MRAAIKTGRNTIAAMYANACRRKRCSVVIKQATNRIIHHKVSRFRLNSRIACLIYLDAEITILPVIDISQRFIAAVSISCGKQPLRAIHMAEAVFPIIGVIDFAAVCAGYRYIRFREIQIGKASLIYFQGALAIGIKDSIHAAFLAGKHISVIAFATFKIVIAVFANEPVIAAQTINAVIAPAAFKIYLVVFLVIIAVAAKDDAVVIGSNAVAVDRESQGTVDIARIRVLAVIHEIPVALHHIIRQIACQFKAVFQITHLQQRHARPVADIIFRHSLRIGRRIFGIPKIERAFLIEWRVIRPFSHKSIEFAQGIAVSNIRFRLADKFLQRDFRLERYRLLLQHFRDFVGFEILTKCQRPQTVKQIHAAVMVHILGQPVELLSGIFTINAGNNTYCNPGDCSDGRRQAKQCRACQCSQESRCRPCG